MSRASPYASIGWRMMRNLHVAMLRRRILLRGADLSRGFPSLAEPVDVAHRRKHRPDQRVGPCQRWHDLAVVVSHEPPSCQFPFHPELELPLARVEHVEFTP